MLKSEGSVRSKTEKASKGLTASLAQFSPQLKKAGLALTALGAAGGFFLLKATQLAARVETLGVVTEVLGKNVGKTKDEIRGLEKAVVDQGITLRAARTSIALMIQSNIDLSNAVDLAAEAQNAAVLAGVDSSEAFQRLVFTITSGNVRMARTLGLQVSFQEAYEKTAASLGKTTLELTQQEKIQARTAEVLKAGTRIVGAYDAAMETAGKKVTSLNRHIEESTRIMGELFLPLFADAVDALTEFLEGIEEATVEEQRVTAAPVAFASAWSGVSALTDVFDELDKQVSTGKISVDEYTASVEEAIEANESFEDRITQLTDPLSRGAFKRRSTVAEELKKELGALSEEEARAARNAFLLETAQNALIGSLRGVGTALADQISNIKLSEISYQDYVKQVEELAEANGVVAITTAEFIDRVNRGIDPIELLSKSVLIASERQHDFAEAAEQSDRKLLRLLGIEIDTTSATAELAEKLGLTEEELLKIAKAAGIAIDGLDELPEDIEIKIQAVLDERVQENIQFQLDKLELQIATTVGADFTEFKEELGGLEQTIEDIEIERIEAIAELEAEGVEDVEKLADGVRNLNRRRDDAIIRLKEMRNRLELAREQLQGMGADTDELARKSKELAIEGLINDIKGQERAVADLRGELGELSGASSDLAAQQEQDITDLNAVYDDKLGAAKEKVEETTKAWSDQTKEILFNLATQQLALGGFTGEELQLIRKLAGPEGLGLIDEAGVALLDFFDNVNMTLAAPGNQVPEVEAAMEAVFQAMVDPEQRVEQLVDKINGIGKAVRDVALEPVTLPGRQQGGPVRRGQAYEVGETGRELFVPNQSGVVLPSSLTSAITSYLAAATSAIPIAGAGAPASAAGGGGTTQNFNMTINSQAQTEQVAADFNLLALMGERRA
jgi:uncharacterized protein YoxC